MKKDRRTKELRYKPRVTTKVRQNECTREENARKKSQHFNGHISSFPHPHPVSRIVLRFPSRQLPKRTIIILLVLLRLVTFLGHHLLQQCGTILIIVVLGDVEVECFKRFVRCVLQTSKTDYKVNNHAAKQNKRNAPIPLAQPVQKRRFHITQAQFLLTIQSGFAHEPCVAEREGARV